MKIEKTDERAAARKKRDGLYAKEPADWTDCEILQELIRRYKPSVIPPCRVCGGELSIGAAGGGEPTRWACSGYEDDPERPGCVRLMAGRKLADEHYARSEYVDRRRGGDGLVMEMIQRVLFMIGLTVREVEERDERRGGFTINVDGVPVAAARDACQQEAAENENAKQEEAT